MGGKRAVRKARAADRE